MLIVDVDIIIIITVHVHILLWLSIVENIRHAFNFLRFISLNILNFIPNFQYFIPSCVRSDVNIMKWNPPLAYLCSNPFHAPHASYILCIIIISSNNVTIVCTKILSIPLCKSTNWSMATMFSVGCCLFVFFLLVTTATETRNSGKYFAALVIYSLGYSL